jgi:plasmid stabilization system protein ParE
MKSRFTSVAETEYADAAAYYEVEACLGDDFIATVLNMVHRLEDHPKLGPVIGLRVRSIPIPRFPFSIVYEILDKEIVIVAVAHQSRKPGYWRDRISLE